MNVAERGANVLVADDEAAIADLVVRVLEGEGFSAKAVYGGLAALAELGTGAYDLAILDVMMPDLDGFEVCRRVRAQADIPIVFLTAKDEEVDQIVGLSLGADDYIVKPFRPRVLVARAKARLRPRRAASAACFEAALHDVALKLTPKEFGILLELVKAAGNPVPAKELYESVWGERFALSAGNSVMVHIRRLREKLAAVDSSRELIATVWGVGYRINTGRAGR